MGKVKIKITNLKYFFLALLLLSCASTNKSHKKSTNDKKADIYFSHGTSKLISKDYTHALKLLLKAAALKPNDAKILNNLGMTFFFKKNYKQSKMLLKRALTLEPENSDARNNLASLFLKLGKLNKAKTEYEIVLKDLIYSHQYRVLYNLALIDFKQGKLKSALKKLEQSVSNKKDHCPAQFLLGKIYFSLRSFNQALKSYQDASKGVCYSEPAPHYMQAVTLEKLNLFEKAKNKYNFIIEKYPRTRYAKLSKKKGALKVELKKSVFFKNHFNIIDEDETGTLMTSPNF